MRTIDAMAAGAVLACAMPAVAATMPMTAVFDFEAVTGIDQGAQLTLHAAGIDLVITREGGGSIGVWSHAGASSGFPAGWGQRALMPLEMGPFGARTGGPFVLTFSRPIHSIAVEAGDFAPSDPDDFDLRAGAAWVTAWQPGSTGFPSHQHLALAGLDTTLAKLSGGSRCLPLSVECYPQSVFWDNVVVTYEMPLAVPEPQTAALLGAGLLGLAWRRRRH